MQDRKTPKPRIKRPSCMQCHPWVHKRGGVLSIYMYLYVFIIHYWELSICHIGDPSWINWRFLNGLEIRDTQRYWTRCSRCAVRGCQTPSRAVALAAAWSRWWFRWFATKMGISDIHQTWDFHHWELGLWYPMVYDIYMIMYIFFHP